MEFADLDHTGEWLGAVDQWERGDNRALAEFVLAYGIQTDAERVAMARMLTTKPDARRKGKVHTEVALHEVKAMQRRKRYIEGEFTLHLRAWVARLRRRLAALGMTDTQIKALLKRHRPGYLKAPKMPMTAIHAAVAKRHGVDPESIKKLRQRRR